MYNSELDYRIRRNKGDQIRPLWSQLFGEAIGRSIDNDNFLSLQETEHLRHELENCLGSTKLQPIRVFKYKSEAMRFLQIVANSVGSNRFIILHRDDRFLGAVVAPIDDVFRNAQSVWDIVGDDLFILSPDLSSGLIMAEEYDYSKPSTFQQMPIYELTCWGDVCEKLQSSTS